MTTARELYPDAVKELIAEYGDEPRFCVTYEEWYFGSEPGDPPSFYEIETFHLEEKEGQQFWGTSCLWIVPGTTEDMLADLQFGALDDEIASVE